MSCHSILHSSSCFSYLLIIKGPTSGLWQADLDMLRAMFVDVNITNEIWCICSPLPQLQETSCHSSLQILSFLSANLVGSCLDGSAFLSYEISELSFPLRFYLSVYSCHETCPWATAWVLSPLFICRREYTVSMMRKIPEACEMEIAVATFERMEGEKKTTKENTLSHFSLPRNSPA